MDSEKDPKTALHIDSADQQLAHVANQEERDSTKWQAIKNNPWSFFWCLFGIWTILLVSFENQAAGIVVGIPQFRKDFGTYYEGNYVLSAEWQAAFQGAPGASQFFGALIAGQIADWIGRRNSIMIALVVSFGAISLEFVSTTNEMFFGGKFLNGFATGILQTVAGSYIGEIVPLALRGLMTCLIALSFTLGPFTVALIVNWEGNTGDRWSYRSIFALSTASPPSPPSLSSSCLSRFTVPNRQRRSPWWLLSRGHEERALKSLHRLGYTAESGRDVKRVAAIKNTLEEVKQETEGVTYAECFRSSNLRRTIVSIAPMVVQQFTGIVFAASYSTYYAQLAGFSTEMSFKLQVIQQVLSMVGNMISWYLIDKTGRRDLTLYGTCILTVVLWVMGGLAVGGTAAMLKGAVAMILIYCFLYNVTIGATAYTCLTETATARLRVKTFSIGVAANLGGKLGFIFGGLCFPCIAFIWWYQPETRHRSYEELDEMFMKRVPARHFKSYKTDAQTMDKAVSTAVTKGGDATA
ncbi:unnamed protein product [Parascedosporium putredinis]|uniref:Major facilitator superfamily (MFS) profile domain-containing protein n=1 Tax=Parascedosporium putredinis TaxID=1442378 RepID=A0A9P1H8E8_9PEZI|nr:unnamed protein product [Parascedosporium putredinis]CAI8000726.1 unnamed protein product [Parascedosporium putredinis]